MDRRHLGEGAPEWPHSIDLGDRSGRWLNCHKAKWHALSTEIYVSGQHQRQVTAGQLHSYSADFEKIEGLSPLLSCIGSCSLLVLRFSR